MKNNPIIPFLLIFSLGVGLIFFMSLYGLDQKEEIAKDGEKEDGTTEEVESEEGESADFDGEVAQGKCITCHGDNLEGGGGPGPALAGTSLSKEELVDIIKNGIPPAMPGGLLPDNQLEDMADYILSLK